MSGYCLSVLAVGVTATTAGTSASFALPTTSAGTAPRLIYAVCRAGMSAHVKIGTSAVAATANDLLVTDSPIVLAVGSATHIAHIQSTTAAVLNVTPLESV